MHPTRLIPALAIVALAATTATTGADAHRQLAHPRAGGSSATFLSRVVRLLAANRYAEAWPSLNPLQQAVAPLQTYVACESQTPIPGRLVSLHVLRVRREPVSVLPDRAPLPSTAVTFVVRIAGAPVPGGVRIVLTAHAVSAGPRWTWIMPLARLRLYAQGCGSESSGTTLFP